jgi:hypothetical protein
MLSSFAITPLAAPTSMLGDKGLSGMTAEQSNKTAKNAWPHPNVAQSVHPAAEHATKHTILSLKMDKFLVIFHRHSQAEQATDITGVMSNVTNCRDGT